MTLGEKIKQLREVRGWSQRQLAEKSGVPLSTIKAIERRKRTHPRTDVLLKIASACMIDSRELFEAAGYEVGEKVERREEPLEEKIARFLLDMPVSIPVYTEFQLSSGGVREEPVKYIFRRRELAAGRNIEAYIVHGQHLRLDIGDGDIVLVDKDLPGEKGDVVLCLIDNQTVLGRLELEGNILWVIVDGYKVKLEECRASAKVIGVRKEFE